MKYMDKKIQLGKTKKICGGRRKKQKKKFKKTKKKQFFYIILMIQKNHLMSTLIKTQMIQFP